MNSESSQKIKHIVQQETRNIKYPEVLQELAHRKTRISYLKGETIFKQGAFAPFVLYVIKGLVKVYLQTGHDKQINLSLAQAGDFLAYASIFGEDIHTYSAVAIKDSEICMIEKESLKELLLRNTEFALEVTTQNYRNEKHLLEVIKNISYKHMRGKLASALLYLSQDRYRSEDVFDYLNRQDLADFASVSTESAIKFLKEFEKEEMILLQGKNVLITDQKKLEIMAKSS